MQRTRRSLGPSQLCRRSATRSRMTGTSTPCRPHKRCYPAPALTGSQPGHRAKESAVSSPARLQHCRARARTRANAVFHYPRGCGTKSRSGVLPSAAGAFKFTVRLSPKSHAYRLQAGDSGVTRTCTSTRTQHMAHGRAPSNVDHSAFNDKVQLQMATPSSHTSGRTLQVCRTGTTIARHAPVSDEK